MPTISEGYTEFKYSCMHKSRHLKYLGVIDNYVLKIQTTHMHIRLIELRLPALVAVYLEFCNCKTITKHKTIINSNVNKTNLNSFPVTNFM